MTGTELIDMDSVVPRDLEITYREKTYIFPGDIDTATVFVLQELLADMAAAEKPINAGNATKAEREVYKKATLAVEKEMTALLRERDQTIDKFPFGSVGFKVLLTQVLLKLGFGFDLPEEPRPLGKRAIPKKRKTASRSRRSSTSRSQSKRSASSPPTGA